MSATNSITDLTQRPQRWVRISRRDLSGDESRRPARADLGRRHGPETV